MPAAGPVRLVKSDGQFTPANLLRDAKSAAERGVSALVKRNGSKNDTFTPGGCLPRDSPERPFTRVLWCNKDQCGGRDIPAGYDRTEWNWGSACTMYNMKCIKGDYDTQTWTVVADCCNGDTPQRDCDPSLCRMSQNCRDKMQYFCDKPSMFGDPRCQKWLNAEENIDKKLEILPKYCTDTSLAGGPCRDFARSSLSHGRMDAAVTDWCTKKYPDPPKVDPKVSEYTRWRFKGAPKPAWLDAAFALTGDTSMNGWIAFTQQWENQMNASAAKIGLEETANPTITYHDNSKDPICACIASPLNKYGDKAAPPSCFDTNCTAGGYQTGGQKLIATKCPSWVECRSNIAASAGGTNTGINVQQICGGPAIQEPVATPTATQTQPLPVPPQDDKDKLLADEARGDASKSNTSMMLPVIAIPSVIEQLNKPFVPGMFGDVSIASVAIMFFAIVIISAILWKTWMNRRSADLAARLQAEQNAQFQTDLASQPRSPEENQVSLAIQEQMSQMPRVTSAQ
jgi:hypothetical protein